MFCGVLHYLKSKGIFRPQFWKITNDIQLYKHFAGWNINVARKGRLVLLWNFLTAHIHDLSRAIWTQYLRSYSRMLNLYTTETAFNGVYV